MAFHNVHDFASSANRRALSARRREQIECEIQMHLNRVEVLIARLDRADGDWDLEEDDPAGDPLEIFGERGGDPGDDDQLSPIRPRYDIDQSKGPVNENEAWKDHQRRMMAS